MLGYYLRRITPVVRHPIFHWNKFFTDLLEFDNFVSEGLKTANIIVNIIPCPIIDTEFDFIVDHLRRRGIDYPGVFKSGYDTAVLRKADSFSFSFKIPRKDFLFLESQGFDFVDPSSCRRIRRYDVRYPFKNYRGVMTKHYEEGKNKSDAKIRIIISPPIDYSEIFNISVRSKNDYRQCKKKWDKTFCWGFNQLQQWFDVVHNRIHSLMIKSYLKNLTP